MAMSELREQETVVLRGDPNGQVGEHALWYEGQKAVTDVELDILKKRGYSNSDMH